MPLNDFKAGIIPEIDGSVVVKADDGRERVVTYIAREAIDDFCQRRDLTDQQRVALATKNLDAIGNLRLIPLSQVSPHLGFERGRTRRGARAGV